MNLEDSVCIGCIHFATEGKYFRETLESPAEYPEPYCGLGCDENFGTPGGCWDFIRHGGN